MVTFTTRLLDAGQSVIGRAKTWQDPEFALDDGFGAATIEDDVVPLSYSTERLLLTRLADRPSVRLYGLSEIRVTVALAQDNHSEPVTDDALDLEAHLIKNDTVLTAVNKVVPTVLPVPEADFTYVFDAADLATLNIGAADVRSAGFGFAFAVENPSTIDSIDVSADDVRIELDYAGYLEVTSPDGEGEDEMDYFKWGTNQGAICLLEEAIADLSTAQEVFTNAPDGTRLIEVTAFNQDVLFAYTQAPDPAADEGQIIPVGTRKIFALNQAAALRVQMIEAAAGATIFISCFG